MKKFTKNEPFFGLDIGTTALRLVALEPSSSGLPRLITYGKLPLAKPYISSESQADKDTLAKEIAGLVSSLKLPTKNVTIGISSKEAFTSVIELPNMPDKEVAKAVDLQADQYIPMAVDDARVDWHVVERTESQTKVLIVAAPLKTIERYSYVVQAAGLDLHAVETDGVALARSLAPNYEPPVVIVSINSSSSTILVVINGVPIVARTVNVGGETFVRSAKQNLNLEEFQAREFVMKFGVMENKLEGQVFKAIKAPLDDLVGEMDKTIKFFYSQHQNMQIEKIIMTGPSTSIPELPLYVANKLQTKIELANSWTNVSYPAQQQDNLAGFSLEFSVAVGLALRSSI